MVRKDYKVQQIINRLREVEVLLSHELQAAEPAIMTERPGRPATAGAMVLQSCVQWKAVISSSHAVPNRQQHVARWMVRTNLQLKKRGFGQTESTLLSEQTISQQI